MEFDWDEAKDKANRAKHGVSLAEAVGLDWADRTEVQDLRADYREDRIVAYACLGDRLHVCVYTLRDETLRIISLRKANNREIKAYGRETETPSD